MSDETRGWMPLTLAQLDFWEEFCFHSDKPVSTVAHCIMIDGPVDEAALAKAISLTIAEADALTLRFQEMPDGEVRQRHVPDHAPRLRLIDLRHEVDPDDAATALMAADFNAILDLSRDPLSAQMLLRTSETRWIWYNRGHHSVLDGYSMLLLEQRCAQLYRHYIGKGPAGEAFLPFTKFIEEDQAYGTSSRFEADKDYWKTYLAGDVVLPVLCKGGEDYGAEGLGAFSALPEDFDRRMTRASVRLGLGWPDLLVLLTGAYMVHRLPYDGSAFPLWMPFMSRMGSVSASIPALAVNILPLLITPREGEVLGDFVARHAGDLRKQRKHGRYRVEQIAADRGIGKGQRLYFSPLVNILPFDPPEFEDCTCERQVLSNGPADGFNVTFRSGADGSGMSLYFEGDPAQMRPEIFARHVADFTTFLLKALNAENENRDIAALLRTEPAPV